MIKVYSIEDEAKYVEVMRNFFSMNPNVEPYFFHDVYDALQLMDETVDCIMLSDHLSGAPTCEQIPKFLEIKDNLPIVCISHQADLERQERIIENGVSEILLKDKLFDWNLKLIYKKIERAVSFNRKYERILSQRTLPSLDSLVGNSIEIERIKLMVQKASEMEVPISLIGPMGTGKELIAKIIYSHSKWRDRPFVKVELSGKSDEDLLTELFGYESGAIQGASKGKKGAFERAYHGILFLSDLDQIGPKVQAKLLDVLTKGSFVRIGGDVPIKNNCRIITSMRKNLSARVETFEFSSELFHKLMGFPIKLYPLKDHISDIAELAPYFLKKIASRDGVQAKTLTQEALNLLLTHSWPHNVKELFVTLQLANLKSTSDKIELDDISLAKVEESAELNQDTLTAPLTLKEFNKRIIEAHLKEQNNDLQKVSEVLQIGKSTLYRMIKNNEIERSK